MVSHWPCVTDFVANTTYGLKTRDNGDEHWLLLTVEPMHFVVQTVGLWSVIICEAPRWRCGLISFQRSTDQTTSTSAFTFSTTSMMSTVSMPTVSIWLDSICYDELTQRRRPYRRPTPRRRPLHAPATPSLEPDCRRWSRPRCRRDPALRRPPVRAPRHAVRPPNCCARCSPAAATARSRWASR